MIKKIVYVVTVWIALFSSSEAITLVKKTLDEQLKEAELIALVKLVETKFAEGPRVVKLLTIEVKHSIFNTEMGERLNILGRNGIVGSDIGFDCLGAEAIILLKRSDPRFAPENYYISVNNSLSVYKIKNGLVSGLVDTELSVDEAIKLLRNKIDDI